MTAANYIPLFLFNSLYIFGLYNLCDVEFLDDDHPQHGVSDDTKNLLWKVKQWSVVNLGWFYSKPICVCPPCMASLHSLYVFWTAVYLFGSIEPVTVLYYLFYAVALSGFNYLILKQ